MEEGWHSLEEMPLVLFRERGAYNYATVSLKGGWNSRVGGWLLRRRGAGIDLQNTRSRIGSVIVAGVAVGSASFVVLSEPT